MSRDHAARAQAFGWSVALGVTTPRDAVAWLDDVLASEPHPSPVLLDATMSERDRPALVHALNDLGAGADSVLVAQLVLADLREAVSSGRLTPRAAAEVMYRMPGYGLVPDEEARHDMHWLEDAYRLGETGILKISSTETDQEVRRFLERFRGSPS